MQYLLDTKVGIALVNGHPLSVRGRVREAGGGDDGVAVSSIVTFELQYGITKSLRQGANAFSSSHEGASSMPLQTLLGPILLLLIPHGPAASHQLRTERQSDTVRGVRTRVGLKVEPHTGTRFTQPRGSGATTGQRNSVRQGLRDNPSQPIQQTVSVSIPSIAAPCASQVGVWEFGPGSKAEGEVEGDVEDPGHVPWVTQFAVTCGVGYHFPDPVIFVHIFAEE